LNQKVTLKGKKLRTQINEKFSDISNADENKLKSIIVEPLCKNYKSQYIYSSIEDLVVVLVFEGTNNNAGLKKMSSFA
jgi:hypothetical protein